jgi:hypothetical protein
MRGSNSSVKKGLPAYDLREPVAVAGRGYVSEFSLDAEISSPTKGREAYQSQCNS